MPVKVELGKVDTLIVPPTPDTIVQFPEPTIGEFPPKVVELPQMLWSDPAFDTEGVPVTLMDPVA